MGNRISKLTRTEFFDVYGLSLILAKHPDNATQLFLLDILQDIATKYVAITRHATTAELRYFIAGGSTRDLSDYSDLHDRMADNRKLLRSVGVTNWKTQRKSLSFNQIELLFNEGQWEDGVYGGPAWGDIAIAGKDLENLLPVKPSGMLQVLNAIDHLNDLEHNNNLYLEQYCTFNLGEALEVKADCEPREVMRKCSKELYAIYRELA